MRPVRLRVSVSLVMALSAILVVGLAATQDSHGEDPLPKAFELTLSPAAEPVPALKYHLLPPLEEQVRGNAAPIYLRVIFDHSSGDWHKHLRDEPERLLKMPLDEMPLDEAKKTLSTFEDVIEQTSAAGFRSDCDWQYVLEDDPLQTLLPDAQSMRSYARLLLLKSRYEIRTGNPRAAIASLRDGFALARHVSRAPFLVNQLVGNAIAEVMITDLDEVIRLDSAPNLYWALNELPQPIVSFDGGLATESKIIQLRFPELAVPKASIAWPELSERMRDWAVDVAKSEGGVEAVLLAAQIQKKATPEQLDRARAELPEIAEYSNQEVAGIAMPRSKYDTRLPCIGLSTTPGANGLACPTFRRRRERRKQRTNCERKLAAANSTRLFHC